jgi:predicted transcriptional regulator
MNPKEEKLLVLLEKEKTYWELMRESGLDYGSLDYYLQKLDEQGKIKRVKREDDVYYVRI